MLAEIFVPAANFVLVANFVLAGFFVPAVNFVLAAIFVLAGIFVFVCFAALRPQVNNYGHRETDSSPNHILPKRLTSTLSQERECLTRDRVAAGSSLTGGVALCP